MGSVSGVDVVPLSPGQERIWTSAQIRPDDPFFNIPFVIDAVGPLDAVLTKACLDHLVRRHASLRSTIQLRDGELCQVIGAQDEVSFGWFRGAVLDLEGTPPDQRDDRAAEEVSALAREPFDLATGPLLRAQLIRLDDRRHRLVVTVHHIVFDGWSLTLLVSELGALYEAEGDPEATFHGPTPDYVSHARRQRIDAEAHAQAVAYWSGRLAGAPGAVELPTERVRPVATDHRGARYTRVVAVAEVAQLRAVARAGRATMFMLLKAACDVVISHYGTHDVVMGVALAGRDRIEIQGLVGYLARPVLLRSDLGQDLSFRQVLASVRDDLLDAHEHLELPFDAVLHDLGARRDLSYNQPYQIMFAYSDERPAQQAGDIVLSVTEMPPATTKVELSIVLTDRADGLRCDVDYREDLFAEEDVKRIVDRLEAVLGQVVADPDMSVSGLRRLSEIEGRSAVDEPNRGARPRPDDDGGVHEQVWRWADAQPDAIAIDAGTRSWTYRQLNEATRAISGRLTEAGVSPGDRVGVCARPSAQFVAGLLAILDSGAVGVLLGPTWHPYSLRNAEVEAEFRVVLADPQPAALFDRSRVTIVDLDTLDSTPEPTDLADPARAEHDRGRTAFVVYGDDDDGEQNAVVLSHRLVATVVGSLHRDVAGPPRPVTPLLSSSASFRSVIEVFLALTVGGTLVPAVDGGLEAAIRAVSGAELICTTPERLRCLCEAQTVPPGAVVITHGEPLPAATAREVLRGLGTGALHHLYGPLEAGWFALGTEIGDPASPRLGGSPRVGVRAYVLGPSGEPVPPGALGELFFGGDGIADGYLDAAATAEAFVPDPLSPRTGGRMFGTGQLARLTSGGAFHVLGDARHLVRKHGHRVDVGQIEEALTDHPEVLQARVILRPDADGQESVVALVARRHQNGAGQVGIGSSALASYLGSRLPGYLHPDRVVVVDSLPLLQTGRLDAERVEEVVSQAAGTAPAASAQGDLDDLSRAREALTESERHVMVAWETVLGHPVPADENFFDAGGSSMLLIRLRNELQHSLGVEVTLVDLFTHPTVRAMAGAFGASVDGGSSLADGTKRGQARRNAYARRGR